MKRRKVNKYGNYTFKPGGVGSSTSRKLDLTNSLKVKQLNFSSTLRGINIKKALFYSLLISVIIYAIFFSGLFRIDSINVQGPNNKLSDDINREAELYLDSRILGRNWLFLSTKDVKESLNNTFTGQESITVDKVFPNKLLIKTDEARAAVVWKTGPKSYRLSSSGKVVSELGANESISSLPVVTDTNNIPVQIGERVVANDFNVFITKLYEYLRSANMEIEQLTVGSTTAEVAVKLKDGYELRFSTVSSVDSQIKSFQAVQDLLKEQNKKPQQYIDLRIDGKAFYK